MDKKKTLLVSVFVEPDYIPELIANGISPFITQLENKNENCEVLTEFSHAGGNNIRLILLVPAALAKTIAKNCDQYFKAYFRNRALLPQAGVFNPDEIFMPFPTNSIQYGIFQPTGLHNQYHISFRNLFSRCLLATLSKQECVDNDLKLSFGLNFMFLLAQAFRKNAVTEGISKTQCQQDFISFIELNDEEENEITQYSKDYADDMVVMYRDIQNDSLFSFAPEWLLYKSDFETFNNLELQKHDLRALGFYLTNHLDLSHYSSKLLLSLFYNTIFCEYATEVV